MGARISDLASFRGPSAGPRGVDRVVVLLEAGVLAVLQYEPSAERFVTVQRITLAAPGLHKHLLGCCLATDPARRVVAVSARANRIAVFFAADTGEAPLRGAPSAAQCHSMGEERGVGAPGVRGVLEDEPLVYVGPPSRGIPAGGTGVAEAAGCLDRPPSLWGSVLSIACISSQLTRGAVTIAALVAPEAEDERSPTAVPFECHVLCANRADRSFTTLFVLQLPANDVRVGMPLYLTAVPTCQTALVVVCSHAVLVIDCARAIPNQPHAGAATYPPEAYASFTMKAYLSSASDSPPPPPASVHAQSLVRSHHLPCLEAEHDSHAPPAASRAPSRPPLPHGAPSASHRSPRAGTITAFQWAAPPRASPLHDDHPSPGAGAAAAAASPACAQGAGCDRDASRRHVGVCALAEPPSPSACVDQAVRRLRGQQHSRRGCDGEPLAAGPTSSGAARMSTSGELADPRDDVCWQSPPGEASSSRMSLDSQVVDVPAVAPASRAAAAAAADAHMASEAPTPRLAPTREAASADVATSQLLLATSSGKLFLLNVYSVPWEEPLQSYNLHLDRSTYSGHTASDDGALSVAGAAACASPSSINDAAVVDADGGASAPEEPLEPPAALSGVAGPRPLREAVPAPELGTHTAMAWAHRPRRADGDCPSVPTSIQGGDDATHPLALNVARRTSRESMDASANRLEDWDALASGVWRAETRTNAFDIAKSHTAVDDAEQSPQPGAPFVGALTPSPPPPRSVFELYMWHGWSAFAPAPPPGCGAFLRADALVCGAAAAEPSFGHVAASSTGAVALFADSSEWWVLKPVHQPSSTARTASAADLHPPGRSKGDDPRAPASPFFTHDHPAASLPRPRADEGLSAAAELQGNRDSALPQTDAPSAYATVSVRRMPPPASTVAAVWAKDRSLVSIAVGGAIEGDCWLRFGADLTRPHTVASPGLVQRLWCVDGAAAPLLIASSAVGTCVLQTSPPAVLDPEDNGFSGRHETLACGVLLPALAVAQVCKRCVRVLSLAGAGAPPTAVEPPWTPPDGADITCAAVSRGIVIAVLGGPGTLYALCYESAAPSESALRTSLGKRARPVSYGGAAAPSQCAWRRAGANVSAVAADFDGALDDDDGRSWTCATTSWDLSLSVYRVLSDAAGCRIVALVTHRLGPDFGVFQERAWGAGDADDGLSTEHTPESLLVVSAGLDDGFVMTGARNGLMTVHRLRRRKRGQSDGLAGSCAGAGAGSFASFRAGGSMARRSDQLLSMRDGAPSFLSLEACVHLGTLPVNLTALQGVTALAAPSPALRGSSVFGFIAMSDAAHIWWVQHFTDGGCALRHAPLVAPSGCQARFTCAAVVSHRQRPECGPPSRDEPLRGDHGDREPWTYDCPPDERPALPASWTLAVAHSRDGGGSDVVTYDLPCDAAGPGGHSEAGSPALSVAAAPVSCAAGADAAVSDLGIPGCALRLLPVLPARNITACDKLKRAAAAGGAPLAYSLPTTPALAAPLPAGPAPARLPPAAVAAYIAGAGPIGGGRAPPPSSKRYVHSAAAQTSAFLKFPAWPGPDLLLVVANSAEPGQAACLRLIRPAAPSALEARLSRDSIARRAAASPFEARAGGGRGAFAAHRDGHREGLWGQAASLWGRQLRAASAPANSALLASIWDGAWDGSARRPQPRASGEAPMDAADSAPDSAEAPPGTTAADDGDCHMQCGEAPLAPHARPQIGDDGRRRSCGLSAAAEDAAAVDAARPPAWSGLRSEPIWSAPGGFDITAEAAWFPYGERVASYHARHRAKCSRGSSAETMLALDSIHPGFVVLGLNHPPSRASHFLPSTADFTNECAQLVVLSLLRLDGAAPKPALELTRTTFRRLQVTALCPHGCVLLAAVGCMLTALRLERMSTLNIASSRYVLKRVPNCDKVTLQPVTTLVSHVGSSCVVAGDPLHSVAVYQFTEANGFEVLYADTCTRVVMGAALFTRPLRGQHGPQGADDPLQLPTLTDAAFAAVDARCLPFVRGCGRLRCVSAAAHAVLAAGIDLRVNPAPAVDAEVALWLGAWDMSCVPAVPPPQPPAPPRIWRPPLIRAMLSGSARSSGRREPPAGVGEDGAAPNHVRDWMFGVPGGPPGGLHALRERAALVRALTCPHRIVASVVRSLAVVCDVLGARFACWTDAATDVVNEQALFLLRSCAHTLLAAELAATARTAAAIFPVDAPTAAPFSHDAAQQLSDVLGDLPMSLAFLLLGSSSEESTFCITTAVHHYASTLLSALTPLLLPAAQTPDAHADSPPGTAADAPARQAAPGSTCWQSDASEHACPATLEARRRVQCVCAAGHAFKAIDLDRRAALSPRALAGGAISGSRWARESPQCVLTHAMIAAADAAGDAAGRRPPCGEAPGDGAAPPWHEHCLQKLLSALLEGMLQLTEAADADGGGPGRRQARHLPGSPLVAVAASIQNAGASRSQCSESRHADDSGEVPELWEPGATLHDGCERRRSGEAAGVSDRELAVGSHVCACCRPYPEASSADAPPSSSSSRCQHSTAVHRCDAADLLRRHAAAVCSHAAALDAIARGPAAPGVFSRICAECREGAEPRDVGQSGANAAGVHVVLLDEASALHQLRPSAHAPDRLVECGHSSLLEPAFALDDLGLDQATPSVVVATLSGGVAALLHLPREVYVMLHALWGAMMRHPATAPACGARLAELAGHVVPRFPQPHDSPRRRPMPTLDGAALLDFPQLPLPLQLQIVRLVLLEPLDADRDAVSCVPATAASELRPCGESAGVAPDGTGEWSGRAECGAPPSSCSHSLDTGWQDVLEVQDRLVWNMRGRLVSALLAAQMQMWLGNRNQRLAATAAERFTQ